MWITVMVGAVLLATTPVVHVPASAAALAPVAQTNIYLPVVAKLGNPRYAGVFIPFVEFWTWDDEVDDFVDLVGRTPAVHLISFGFGCEWANEVSDLMIQLNHIKSLGGMPLITWMPMDCTNGGTGNVNNLGLPDILSGAWDAYITEWAADIAALGYPVFVRWGHEMNIPTYSWGAQYAFGSNGRTHYTVAAGQGCGLTNCFGVNGQYDGPERYKAAYQRVYNLANPIADNIIWVWNPNARNWPLASDQPWNHYSNYYPGDAYVDWVALDGYNWGPSSGNGHGHWIMFNEMFGAELNDLRTRYPAKPQMIAEFAAVEDPNDPNRKANFIRDAYQQARNHPNLNVLIWVHDDDFIDMLHFCPGTQIICPAAANFRVDSSPAALQAYKDATASWATNAPFP
jgi:hypothetical protein